MTVKFSEKSLNIFGCKQIAENVPVVNDTPTGTILATAQSTAITGTSTAFLTEVAPYSYIYNLNDEIIGQVNTVNSNTSITLVDAVSNLAVAQAEGTMALFGKKEVTFTIATDLVTLNSHGLTTGDGVKFSVITTTTGISTGTVYYVNKQNAHTFKLYDTSANAIAGSGTGLMNLATGDGTGTLNALSGVAFKLGMGPRNALPTLNFNFTTEFTTEAFQYLGSNLDRDEQTSVTDKFAKFDFEALMPALGGVNNTVMSTGTGKLASQLGSNLLMQRTVTSAITNATIAAEVSVGDQIFTAGGVLVGKVAQLNTDVTFTDVGDLVTIVGHQFIDGTAIRFAEITTTTGITVGTTYFVRDATDDTFKLAASHGGAAVALTSNGTGKLRTVIVLEGDATLAFNPNVGFKVGKASTVPTDRELPMGAWMEAVGFGWVKGNGYAMATNAVSSNSFLTVELHQSSDDMVSENKQKIYTATDCRGTVDLDVTVGKRGKLKFDYMGNLDSIADKLTIVADYETKKDDIADTAKSNVITLSSLSPYTSLISAVLPNAGIGGTSGSPSTATFIVGGLTFTAGDTVWCSSNQLVNILNGAEIGQTGEEILAAYAANIPDGETLPGDWTLTGTLRSYYIRKAGVKTLYFYSPGQYGNLASLSITGTAPASTVTVISNNAEPPTADPSNICFEKLIAPKVNGYDYARYQLSCNDGWSKNAMPSDVTLTIIEDRADADYKPDDNVERNHKLVVNYGSNFNNKFISVRMYKVQLGKYTGSKVAGYLGQDLNFRNIGTTEIRFS